MKLIRIDKKSWANGIEKLKEAYHLFGPVKNKHDFEFERLEKGKAPEFENYQNTRLSPKSVIYPQSQKMFRYSLDENSDDNRILKEIEFDDSPRALFGVRPCDALSFPLVRKNFDTPEYQDVYWVKAFESTTFVGLACDNPCGTCFCTSAGTTPYGEEGLDILITDDGDAFIAKAITAKGETLLDAAGWTDTADADTAAKLETKASEAEAAVKSRISTNQLTDKTILELYDAPFWEEIAFSCINCGTCTYVCPTCWCFDIQDEVSGKSGIRMRNWDSCMFPLFTHHASGHNPRDQKFQRARQRFMHKLKYYVDKYNNGIQCVGCGRCVRLCPVNIDIREICDKMNAYDPKSCAREATSS